MSCVTACMRKTGNSICLGEASLNYSRCKEIGCNSFRRFLIVNAFLNPYLFL